jgi:hypothetical protein
MTDRTILHSGPPVAWEDMAGPMQGAIIGAMLFEGLAPDDVAARKMCEQGAIEFSPCHHLNAVGPMAGVISASMPVLVIEDANGGNRAFSNLNEGLGKALRFGAYGEDVLSVSRGCGTCWVRRSRSLPARLAASTSSPSPRKRCRWAMSATTESGGHITSLSEIVPALVRSDFPKDQIPMCWILSPATTIST